MIGECFTDLEIPAEAAFDHRSVLAKLVVSALVRVCTDVGAESVGTKKACAIVVLGTRRTARESTGDGHAYGF